MSSVYFKNAFNTSCSICICIIFTFASKHDCFSNLNFLNDVTYLASISSHWRVIRQPLVVVTATFGTLGSFHCCQYIQLPTELKHPILKKYATNVNQHSQCWRSELFSNIKVIWQKRILRKLYKNKCRWHAKLCHPQ